MNLYAEPKARCAAALAAVLSPDYLGRAPEQAAAYEGDGLTALRRQPMAVTAPRPEGKVQAVLNARLDRIERPDSSARIAVVEPGVRNLAIEQAAARASCFTPPVPARGSSAPSAAMWRTTPTGEPPEIPADCAQGAWFAPCRHRRADRCVGRASQRRCHLCGHPDLINSSAGMDSRYGFQAILKLSLIVIPGG